MKSQRLSPNVAASPERADADQSLRNRIAARMLLAGVVPVAVVSVLRVLWTEGFGLPEEHVSFQVVVASLVLILCALMASLFSRWMLLRARGSEAGDARGEAAETAETADVRGAAVGLNPEARERSAAFACLLEAGSDAVILVDHCRGQVLGASRRFREIFGMAGDALAYSEVKTRVASCFPEPARFAEIWTRMATSGTRIGGESWRTAGMDGRELMVFSERLRSGDEEGEAPPRLWIFVDITEEVALRSALCRAQRLESVGALVGGLAHDFNNMLTGIIGNLALVEIEADGGRDWESGLRYLERAKGAGMRAAELARHLVGYACVSGGGRRSVDLGCVLREVERLVRPGLASGIGFRVVAGEGIGSIMGDCGEIEWVLVSLCVDAREALAGREDGEIVVVAREASEDSDRVELLVRDNRAGAPTGVPATAGEIILRHGGTLFREEGDEGATVFRISLPRAGAREAGLLALDETRMAWAFPRDGRGRETILIVDDEEVVRTVGEQMLLCKGYTVRSAGDGQAALDLYDAAPYEIDAVLMDLTMPRLSGAATFRMLKERDAALPIIVCSGHEVDAGSFEAENGWCPDGILRKPFDIDGLACEVRRVLDAHVGVVLEAEA